MDYSLKLCFHSLAVKWKLKSEKMWDRSPIHEPSWSLEGRKFTTPNVCCFQTEENHVHSCIYLNFFNKVFMVNYKTNFSSSGRLIIVLMGSERTGSMEGEWGRTTPAHGDWRRHRERESQRFSGPAWPWHRRAGGWRRQQRRRRRPQPQSQPRPQHAYISSA